MAPTSPQVQGVRDRVPARGPLRLRAVLRPARGRVRPLGDSTPRRRKRKIQAGPAGIWRYADFLPFAERPRDPLEPGLTPLVRADRLAERLGLGELWIKNDAANPTHSFKDRVVAVAIAKARELGFDDRRLRLDRQPRERRRRARGRRGARLVRLRPVRPRGAEAARHRRLRHPAGRRAGQLRRRQPALHRALRGAALGVRERQPAPVLRGGLEDARLRDRRAARLGAPGPGRRARSPRARCSRRSARASASGSSWASSTASCRPSTAPRRRAAARSPRRSPRAGTSAGRSARTRSPRASRSAIRPTAPTRSSSRGGPAASIESVTDDEIRAGIRLLAETTGIFTETAGGVTIAVLAKLAERGAIDRRRARGRLHHRRGPEDARRRPRGLPRCTRSSRRWTAFEAEVAGGGASPGARSVDFPADGGHREDPGAAARRHRRRGRARGRGRDGRRGARRRLRRSTRTCASGSPRTGRCAGSSTSTSPARTSASRTGSTPSSPTATR